MSSHLFPKLSWAQNRRSVHITFHISKNQNQNPSQPSIVFSKQDNFKTLTMNCQGCLPNENPNETIRNFEISLELFAPVFPIEGQNQIKVTEKYVRLCLFKKAKRTWEKLTGNNNSKSETNNTSSAVSSSVKTESQDFCRRNHRTAIIYDWDLDGVLERQMNDALEEADMLKDDYSDDSSSNDGEGEEEDGFEAGASEPQSSMTESFAERNASKKKVLRKTAGKTSRISKDVVYGDMSSTDPSSDDEKTEINNNKSTAETENNNKDTNTNNAAPSPSAKTEENEKQKQKDHIIKKQHQMLEKQIFEMNKILPAGQRRSLTDRQVLILVIVVATIVGLLAAVVGGSVVYMNMSSLVSAPSHQLKEKQANLNPQQKSADL